MNRQLITDSACDLPLQYIQDNHIEVLCLEVNVKGNFIEDDLGQSLPYKQFYNLLREGELTSTSQVNVHKFEEAFKKYAKEGKDIVYIGLAAILSGTVNSALMAKARVLEEYPDAVIHIIDSKCACSGEGLLVHYACEMIKENRPLEEILKDIEALIPRVCQDFIVDDLNFLKRGGRVSSTAAAIGSLLNIKPTLKIDDEGRVTLVGKVKGRKKAIHYLVDRLKNNGENLENQTIFIAHADDEENVRVLSDLIKEETPVKEIKTHFIGTVIGSHVGPGTLAVFYLGKER
jgi:DegV family protein with EDD domain